MGWHPPLHLLVQSRVWGCGEANELVATPDRHNGLSKDRESSFPKEPKTQGPTRNVLATTHEKARPIWRCHGYHVELLPLLEIR